MNTALVITFDEHGGTYDHVPPPPATPPDAAAPGEMGFAFDRLACRVPAIVVSAYTATGHRHPRRDAPRVGHHHALPPARAAHRSPLRDQSANPIFNAMNLTEPRQPYAWPKPHVALHGRNPEEDDATAAGAKHKRRPLTAPAQGLTGLLLARFNPGS